MIVMPYHTDPRLNAWLGFWDYFNEHLLLTRLAETVPCRLKREHILAWRHGDHLDHARLISKLRPDREHRGAPRITRISINHLTYEPSARTLRSLLFSRSSHPSPTPGLHVEWTALDDELVELARWLPTFLHGKLDPSLAIPAPPVPSHVWGQGLRRINYAWTAPAWAAYQRFHGRDPDFLWRFVTPAWEVRAEPGIPAGVASAEPAW